MTKFFVVIGIMATVSSAFADQACDSKLQAIFHVMDKCPGALELARKDGAFTTSDEINFDSKNFEHTISFALDTSDPVAGPGKVTKNYRKIIVESIPIKNPMADGEERVYRCKVIDNKKNVIGTFGNKPGDSDGDPPRLKTHH